MVSKKWLSRFKETIKKLARTKKEEAPLHIYVDKDGAVSEDQWMRVSVNMMKERAPEPEKSRAPLSAQETKMDRVFVEFWQNLSTFDLPTSLRRI